MRQKVKYIATYSYNAGLLGTDKSFDTEAEARTFTEKYKNEFKDCNKFYTINKITYTKRFLRKEKIEVEKITNWLE